MHNFVVTIALFLVSLQVSAAAQFAYRRTVTINHETTIGANLVHFPVYFSVADPALRSLQNGGHVEYSNGSDIAFFEDAALTKVLPFEIETYDPTVGKLVAWVDVPQIGTSVDTQIYLGYGNKLATQALAISPWSNSFLGVYHFNRPTNPGLDSTDSHRNGTAVNCIAAPGYLENALQCKPTNSNESRFEPGVTNFDVAQQERNDPNDPPNTTKSYTISFWFQYEGPKTGTNQPLWTQARNPAYTAYSLYIDGNGEIRMHQPWATDGNANPRTIIYMTPGWHHLGFATGLQVDQATEVFIDGRKLATIPTKNLPNYSYYGGRAVPLYVAGLPSYWNPSWLATSTRTIIDELRVENVARDENYFNALYINQSSPSSFYSVSPEVKTDNSEPPKPFLVSVVGVTSTQAVLSYRAPTSGPCVVQLSDSSALNPLTGLFAALVNDTNPKLFLGSDRDSRAGILGTGVNRILVLGARDVGLATDGKLYSRALQAYTQHFYSVTCEGGKYKATGDFRTKNIALGNSAPDTIPFSPHGFGNYGWPTIDFQDINKSYIDPQTGLLLRRWTSPGDEANSIETNLGFSFVDAIGSGWTNTSSIGGGQPASTSSSGADHAIFAAGVNGVYRPGYNALVFTTVDDIRLRISGYGSSLNSEERTLSTCLSSDYGQTCLGTALDVVLPTISGQSGFVSVPQAWPAKLLQGWGNPRLTPDVFSNNYPGAASLKGNVLTWISNNGAGGRNIYFPVNVLKPGMRIAVSGTAPTCPRNLCEIAQVVDERTLVLKQSVPSWTSNITTLTADASIGSNSVDVSSSIGLFKDVWGQYSFVIDSEKITCRDANGTRLSGCSPIQTAHRSGAVLIANSYWLPNFGFKVWKKKSGGQVFIGSLSNDWATSNTMYTGFQGAEQYCSGTTVTASYAADGVTPITPEIGRMCTLSSTYDNPHVYWVSMRTGESRHLLSFNGQTVTGDHSDATKFSIFDRGSQTRKQCQYFAAEGKFKSWQSGYSPSAQNPAFRCESSSTDGVTGGQTSSILQQITTKYPQIDPAYFGPPRVASASGNLYSFTLKPRQDALAWFCTVDFSKPVGQQVLKCRNTWDTYPLRWSGAHGDQVMNGGYLQIIEMNSLANKGEASIEQWELTVNSVDNNGGQTALSSSFTDPKSCEELGVHDHYWISLGATGRRCIKMNVATEPLARGANSKDLAKPGAFPVGSKPVAWAHNATRCGGDGTTTECSSFLQAMQEGDAIQDAKDNFGGEKFIIVKKSIQANGTIDLVLLRNANPSNCQASSAPSAHAASWTPIMWPPATCGGATYWNGFYDDASMTYIDNSVKTGQDNGLFGGHTVLYFISGSIVQFSPYAWNMPREDGGYGAGYGVRNGPFPEALNKGAQFGINMIYPFARSKQGIHVGYIQSHPGGIQWAAPPSEQVWGLDGRPLGGAAGGATALWYHKFENIGSSQNVYKVSLPQDASGNLITWNQSYDVRLDRKRRAMIGFAGYHLLRDMSGPRSQISDATPWTFCVADLAGECAIGSNAGDQFVSVPNANVSGLCDADYQYNTPCLTTAGPQIAGYTQFGIDQPDPTGLRWRKLTMMFGGPGRTSNYANMHTTVAGEWGVSAVAWGDGRRTDVFAAKLPPWPGTDSINRNDFIPIPVALEGKSGTAVRVRFGYDTRLYCSSRQEQCSTAVSNQDPYAWLTEPQAWQDCGDVANGCVVKIPAVSNRVLYYIVDRKDAAGRLTSGALNVSAVP